MKKICLVLVLFIGALIVGNELFSSTMAYSYKIDKSVLFYKENEEELADDIKVYLENVDDYLIRNSSYLYGDKLVQNYDFLVHFALDYILSNREYYVDSIRKGEECLYINKEGVGAFTYDYVDISVVYEVTNFYFGIKL